MRRRIIGGLLVIIVGSVVAFLFSGPKKGSVAYHKKEYLAAWKRVYHEATTDKAKEFLYRTVGSGGPEGTWDEEAHKRMRSHQAALVRLGYLAEQTFVLTNCTKRQVFNSPAFSSAWVRHNEFVSITVESTNILHFIAVREDVPLFVEAIRKVEKP